MSFVECFESWDLTLWFTDLAEQHQDRWLHNGDSGMDPSALVQARLGEHWNNNNNNKNSKHWNISIIAFT